MASLSGNFDNLRFFDGRRRDCMKALGGLLNCCKKPPPTNQSPPFWEHMKKMLSQSTNADGQASSTDEMGSWANMMAGASHEDLMANLTSSMEGLLGGGTTGGGTNQDGTISRSFNEYFSHATTEVKPSLGWYCDNDEFELAVGRQVGNCTHLGSYCQTRVLGFCVIKKDRYCCFNSPVTRVLREHLDETGVADLGTARHPRCEGITFEQMSAINPETVDENEIIGRMHEGNFMPDLQAMANADFSTMESLLDGANSLLGDTSRLSPSDRNEARLSATDPGAAYESVEASQQAYRPEVGDTGNHANTVQMNVAQEMILARTNSGVAIPVTRDGRTGLVLARLRAYSGTTASVGTDYILTPDAIGWDPGIGGQQNFRVQIPAGATPGRIIVLELYGTHDQDGTITDLVIHGKNLVRITIEGD